MRGNSVMGLLIRDSEVGERPGVDVRIRDGRVVEIGLGLQRDGEEELPAAGGALIPGLHDHHLHLFALAASLESVDCSPAAVADAQALATALRTAANRGPVRATGYFESVAGALDRDILDGIVADVAVRVQHRSGAIWFLNSLALAHFGLLESTDPAVERTPDGRATGRMIRGDGLLRDERSALPDLAAVGNLLAARGVTGVTDATPRLDGRQLAALRSARVDGALPQRLVLLGAALDDPGVAGVPWKILVDEMRDLEPTALVGEVAAAHAAGRPVALHCTSRAECVLAVNALREAGSQRGDRLEHAGLLPREFDAELARAGVTVVTQPHFISERGDDYLENVEPDDHDLLYRCGSLIDGRVRVAAGTDAPYGQADPWAAIAAAVSRRTVTGQVIGSSERLTPSRALDLFLGDQLDPGGPARRIEPGSPADLCLLAVPLADMLEDPRGDLIRATVVAGQVVHA